MINIYIDNKKYIVDDKSKNLLQYCLEKDLDIPYFCWHPQLGSFGSCRQCAVKRYRDINDSQGIIVMSCMTEIEDQLLISIQDKEVTNFRKNILELMMTNHPHDCPVCSEGGNCHLQDMTVLTGHYKRRYFFKKRTYKSQYLGPFINHEMNRCISCYRCVRFYKDYAGGKDFNVYGSANNLYFGRITDGVLESEHSGNLIEVCPTGVFTDKTQDNHYSRKWDMQYAPSVCQHCSVGCNIIIGERSGKIRKVENRFNEHINNYFICDVGRFNYDISNTKNRPSYSKKIVNNETIVLSEAESLLEFIKILKESDNVIGIGSSRSSIENNFALQELVGEKNFSSGMLRKEHEITEFIASVLKYSSIHIPSLKEVEECDAIIIFGEDILKTAPRLSLSIRQAVKHKNNRLSNYLYNQTIYSWQSSAINNLIQNKQNPFFIINYQDSELDELCSDKYSRSLIEPIKIMYKIKEQLINKNQGNSYLKIDDNKINNYVFKIVNALIHAKKPLIISGSNCLEKEMVQLAFDISKLIQKFNNQVGLILITPNPNSIGVALMNGICLDNVLKFIKKKKNTTLIFMENDIYQNYSHNFLNELFNKKDNKIIVLDHNNTLTLKKANLQLPTKNIFESSGTFLNYEGRLQRFFQVYDPSFYNDHIKRLESWRWLHNVKAKLLNKKPMWLILDDVINACSIQIPCLKNIKNITPNSLFRIFGQKLPRSPQRFSGRTSMYANYDIHEHKQPEDRDTMFAFSMEGSSNNLLHNDSSTEIPFYWSAGWNSVQSGIKSNLQIPHQINKNIRNTFFISKNINKESINFYENVKKNKANINKQCLKIIPYYFLFTPQVFAFSNMDNSVKNKNINITGIIHSDNASIFTIQEYSFIEIQHYNDRFKVFIKFSNNIHHKYIALPFRTPYFPFVLLGKIILPVEEGKWKVHY
ncbi:NADH-quinone oxidoreductase subunit G [Buchnera aphidicola (Thelaxes suberi)]|uniref:NADH-quinone oxidoreductase subunit NuoG n=1 Tax=Buchnera aphidicola TaxID=9 RepID=UPI0034642719